MYIKPKKGNWVESVSNTKGGIKIIKPIDISKTIKP